MNAIFDFCICITPLLLPFLAIAVFYEKRYKTSYPNHIVKRGTAQYWAVPTVKENLNVPKIWAENN